MCSYFPSQQSVMVSMRPGGSYEMEFRAAEVCSQLVRAVMSSDPLWTVGTLRKISLHRWHRSRRRKCLNDKGLNLHCLPRPYLDLPLHFGGSLLYVCHP